MQNQKFPSALELVRRAFKIYFIKEHLIYLTKVNLFGLLASFAILSPLIILGFFGGETLDAVGRNSSAGSTVFFIVLLTISVVASIIWGVWFQATVIKALSLVSAGKTKGVKETFLLTWPRVGKYALTTFVVALGFSGGILLLIIPGILVLVWYTFASFIIVEEDIGVKAALGKSKKLVSGHFWSVAGRGLVFVFLSIFIQVALTFIPIVGPLVAILARPLYVLLPYVMYKELARIKAAGIDASGELVKEGAPV